VPEEGDAVQPVFCEVAVEAAVTERCLVHDPVQRDARQEEDVLLRSRLEETDELAPVGLDQTAQLGFDGRTGLDRSGHAPILQTTWGRVHLERARGRWALATRASRAYLRRLHSSGVNLTPDTPGGARAAPATQRFRGFPLATRQFLEELARSSAASTDRASYAAWVLSPLKTLCAELAALLADVRPSLSFVARVDGSLARLDGDFVRRLRAWDAGSSVDASPLLYADLTAEGVEVGAASAGADPEATARVRRSLLQGSDGSLRASCAALLSGGWRVSGEALSDAGDGSVPEDLRAWLRRRDLRVHRIPPGRLINEPDLASEIADRLREPPASLRRHACAGPRGAPPGTLRRRVVTDDPFRLDGKVALVTGGGTGIGRGVAQAFARAGARVVVCGRRRAPLEETVELAGRAAAIAAPGDVTVAADRARWVAAAREEPGGLDVLVNCAGAVVRSSFAEMPEAEWRRLLDVNALGPILLSREALPILRARKGSILQISTGVSVRPVRGLAAYGAAKAALNQASLVLALEAAPDVRVNVLCPGGVDTPIFSTYLSETDAQAARRWFSEATPLAASLSRHAVRRSSSRPTRRRTSRARFCRGWRAEPRLTTPQATAVRRGLPAPRESRCLARTSP
jgi:NAD(P)-dependent dehydrogenase (short-subunit alcohol dehydrogenase family)